MNPAIGEWLSGNWIKIVMFILGAIVLGSIAVVMIDPGLGTPDESRRARHPAGFSFVPPHGWGATVMYAGRSDGMDMLRISPERSTGRQPTIGVARFQKPITPSPGATPYTFQGKPAFLHAQKLTHNWNWHIEFQRDGTWYRIELAFPLETDVENSPYMPFINSFRVEKTLDTNPTPSTAPAITLPD